MRKIFYFILILLTGFQISYAQKNVYVATTGSNQSGTGTLDSPYATLQHALDQASAGDTINLRGGTYDSNEATVEKSNMTIRSYKDEWAIITAPNNDDNIQWCIAFDHEVVGGTLERLELVGGYYYSVMLHSNWDWGQPQRFGARNITIKDCKIHDSGRDCIKITPGSDNTTIQRCEIYNSGQRDDSNAEGIDNVNGDNMRVQFCHIHDIATSGMYAKGGATNCIIENNLVRNCGAAGIMLGFYTDGEWFDEVANPDYYGNIDGIVRNNIVLNVEWAGIGLFAALRPKVYNNTVVGTSTTYHAALYLDKRDVWFDETTFVTTACKDVTVQNNIFVQSQGVSNAIAELRPSCYTGFLSLTNNLYYKHGGANFRMKDYHWADFDLATWKTATGQDANSTEQNPLLDANYHLTSNSPCIDKAVAITGLSIDYENGTRQQPFDIGADEYNAGEILSVPPAQGTIGTGCCDSPVIIAGISDIRSESFALGQNYPNPFTQKTNIDIQIAQRGNYKLSLFNALGQEISTIYSGNLETGKHNFEIDRKTLKGGYYYYRLETTQHSLTKRMLLTN